MSSPCPLQVVGGDGGASWPIVTTAPAGEALVIRIMLLRTGSTQDLSLRLPTPSTPRAYLAGLAPVNGMRSIGRAFGIAALDEKRRFAWEAAVATTGHWPRMRASSSST